jgi:phage terminase Nu1 subunit (DNA packaging protein)
MDFDSMDFEGPEPDPFIVNKAGLASLTGLTIKQLDTLRREGLPTHAAARRGIELLFNVRTAFPWMLAKASEKDELSPLDVARQRQAEAQARRIEAVADKITGELVSLETVTAAARDAAAVWRSELLSLPARCPVEAQTVVQAEVNRLINSVADKIAAITEPKP